MAKVLLQCSLAVKESHKQQLIRDGPRDAIATTSSEAGARRCWKSQSDLGTRPSGTLPLLFFVDVKACSRAHYAGTFECLMKSRALRTAKLTDVVTSACSKRLRFIIWLFDSRAVIRQSSVFESRYQLSVELIATRSHLSSSTAPSAEPFVA